MCRSLSESAESLTLALFSVTDPKSNTKINQCSAEYFSEHEIPRALPGT